VRVQVWHVPEAARAGVEVDEEPALDIDKHACRGATATIKSLSTIDRVGGIG
jgi:hypothetical protein